MGRHFDSHVAGALRVQTCQLSLHQQRVGRRHAVFGKLPKHAATQSANHTARLGSHIEGLSKHLANTGFAIGAGYTDHLQLLTGLLIKKPGQFG